MYFGAAFGLGTVIGSLITGVTWQGGLGSEFTFTWAAIACLLGAFIIFIVPNKRFVIAMKNNRT
jgi:PPP family 3-phenylpropionic acid transporter